MISPLADACGLAQGRLRASIIGIFLMGGLSGADVMQRMPMCCSEASWDAQVLETGGQLREAVEAYRHRVALGGWAEEAFEAQMRVVCILP